MAVKLETWMIAVIAVSGTLVLVLLICCLWKCCRRSGSKPFRWIDRLGIPFANEGQPTQEELSKEMKVRVTLDQHTRASNLAYDTDAEETERVNKRNMADDNRMRAGTVLEEPEPFKRLDQLGIPRAQIGHSPSLSNGRKIPRSPLPSPINDNDGESSSDEDISIQTT